MKCKHNPDMEDKKGMSNPTIQEKGGRYSARGECPDCGTGMFKFLSKDDAKQTAQDLGIEIEHVSKDDE